MKRAIRGLPWLPVLLLLGAGGCDNGSTRPTDHSPPAAPRGVTSVTGDRQVTLAWYPNGEWDLQGYHVYRDDRGDGSYSRIGWAPAPQDSFVDRAVQNGDTYFYAVSAVDQYGDESELSPERVRDTPRPQGEGLVLHSYDADPNHCSYSFALEQVLTWDDPAADIGFGSQAGGSGYMLGLYGPGPPSGTSSIQDAGFHAMDDVSWAPPDGWSPSGMVELIPGHVYVVWTRDDHYAKFRVAEIAPDSVVIDWAYQTVPANQELRELRLNPGSLTRNRLRAYAEASRSSGRGEAIDSR